jgi:hypothetical protein
MLKIEPMLDQFIDPNADERSWKQQTPDQLIPFGSDMDKQAIRSPGASDRHTFQSQQIHQAGPYGENQIERQFLTTKIIGTQHDRRPAGHACQAFDERLRFRRCRSLSKKRHAHHVSVHIVRQNKKPDDDSARPSLTERTSRTAKF